MPKNQTDQLIRLNKYIAQCGVASRRKADELIDTGKVSVNGKKTYELGSRINPKKDTVTVYGRSIKTPSQKVYYIFHKPRNILTSMSDPEGRPVVADFFKHLKVRLFSVGRLDWDTEGLLLLTNDGEFSNEIAHPKSQIPKTYLAKLDGTPTQEQLNKLVRGVSIIGGKVRALRVEKVKGKGSKKYDWIQIVITEGKNRQVKKMFEKIGYDVKKLKRIAIGQLTLGRLARGEYQKLTTSQLMKIFEIDQKLYTKKKSTQ